jgi:ATP-independent RNA helicase DbpA
MTDAVPASPASPPAVHAGDAGATTLSFDRLPLAPATLANLRQLGYLQMTPIQAASLPPALAGQDLIAQAKTGSGKTAAFALSLLARLNPRRFAVQALVLCPTRELADQVTQEIRRLARGADNIKVLTLCGGSTMRPQISSLEHGAHVVVGTPGRILDHLQRASLDLSALDTLVLDEADRMLDMGFYDDIATVAKACPKTRQTLLFSATYPEGIARLSQAFLRQPQRITLPEQHEPGKIRQRFYEVDADQKLAAVGLLLNHYRPVSTLAFCNTRQQCRDLLQQVARRRLRRPRPARRDGTARTRPGAGPVRQPQLLGAGRHRRRRARPRHRPAGGGDQRRCHAGHRGPCPSHRPHRARRPGRLGLQPGQRQPDGARRQHREGPRP